MAPDHAACGNSAKLAQADPPDGLHLDGRNTAAIGLAPAPPVRELLAD
jgi:hypothetical protein